MFRLIFVPSCLCFSTRSSWIFSTDYCILEKKNGKLNPHVLWESQKRNRMTMKWAFEWINYLKTIKPGHNHWIWFDGFETITHTHRQTQFFSLEISRHLVVKAATLTLSRMRSEFDGDSSGGVVVARQGNALTRREEQLRRWAESDTSRAPTSSKLKAAGELTYRIGHICKCSPSPPQSAHPPPPQSAHSRDLKIGLNVSHVNTFWAITQIVELLSHTNKIPKKWFFAVKPKILFFFVCNI